MTDIVMQSAEEVNRLRERCFDIEQNIKRTILMGTASWWACCEQVFQFREERGWEVLGYESIETWLAQPDVEISRRLFFRMCAMWRDLVTIQRVPPAALAEVEPSKIDEARPVIMRGDCTVEEAIEDAKVLGKRDMRERYHVEPGEKPGGKALAAEAEPQWTECPTCGTKIRAERLTEGVGDDS